MDDWMPGATEVLCIKTQYSPLHNVDARYSYRFRRAQCHSFPQNYWRLILLGTLFRIQLFGYLFLTCVSSLRSLSAFKCLKHTYSFILVIGWTNEEYGQEEKISILSRGSRQVLKFLALLLNAHRVISQGIRYVRGESDDSPSPSAEVKNAWSYASITLTPSWRKAE